MQLCSTIKLLIQSLSLCVLSIISFTIAQGTAVAALIDDFERGDFSIATIDGAAGPSVHLSIDPNHVIAGDRDVWTSAHDGDGSITFLTTDGLDNGAVVSSNSEGSIYWVNFHYDGPGINTFSLNADLTSESHDAFLVSLMSVSTSSPAHIRIELRTNMGELTEALASQELLVTGDRVVRFPYSAFDEDFGILDFEDVDSIRVAAKLGASSSITISEISTGLVPEPSTMIVLLFLSGPVLSMYRPVHRYA